MTPHRHAPCRRAAVVCVGTRSDVEQLDPRKSAILRRVVREHIETAQPVGSAHVVQDPSIDVSPATVRADMSALEREGYLTHPHTSAGRIPTEKGYRYFVDHIADPEALDPARQMQVADFFARAQDELEHMLRDTTQLLAHLTDYAAVVVAPSHAGLNVRSCLLTGLSPGVALLVVVLSNGAVEKHVVHIDDDAETEQIDAASRLLREHLEHQTIGQISSPAPRDDDRAVDRIVDRCCLALAGSVPSQNPTGDEVFVGGTDRVAEQLGAVESVRAVLSILEQSFVVVSLLQGVLGQSQGVAIGSETGLDSLAECSLVVAPYKVSEAVVGTIGLLGPTRMNYPQALAAVAVVGEQLSQRLAAQ